MTSSRAQSLFAGALIVAALPGVQAALKPEPLPATGAGFVVTSERFR